MKKKIPEETRFSKKALNLTERIIANYKKPKIEPHPYSFGANKHRITFVFGLILIIYSIFKLDIPQEHNTNNNCGVVGKLATTLNNGNQSIAALYKMYKDGALKTASKLETQDIKTNSDKKIYIDFKNKDRSGNILVCGERAIAKIGQFNKLNSTLEYQTIDWIVGGTINNNQLVSNAFLQLEENDDVIVAFNKKIDDTEESILDLVYISEIKTEQKHYLSFYDVNILENYDDKIINCKDHIDLIYTINNLTTDSITDHNVDTEIGGNNSPIILDRVLVGNNINSSIKITTKIKNLCVFKDGIKYDICGHIWNIPNIEEHENDIVVVNIKPVIEVKK